MEWFNMKQTDTHFNIWSDKASTLKKRVATHSNSALQYFVGIKVSLEENTPTL